MARLKECPFCKDIPFQFNLERGVRLLLQEMKYPCKYCNEPFSKGNLEVHESYCNKKPRHCGVLECNFASNNKNEALQHFIEIHGDDFWQRYNENTARGLT